MLHHDRNYLATLDQERLRRAAHHRPPADARELESIVLDATAGDQRAWSILSTRFETHVRRIARSHGLNSHDADDVTQETMLQLFRNIVRIREPRALGAWLRTTARRESLRAIESRQRVPPTDADLGAELAAPDDDFGAIETAACGAALAHVLDRLPDRHRLLMTALFAETAESYAEISARLGIPQGSIGPIRARCLDRLRSDLDAAAFE
jgi:RNA polymerase sigma factor (sigma-70 family)